MRYMYLGPGENRLQPKEALCKIARYGRWLDEVAHLYQGVKWSDVWLSIFDSEVAKMEVGQLRHHKVNLDR